jgi:hypothetical protein
VSVNVNVKFWLQTAKFKIMPCRGVLNLHILHSVDIMDFFILATLHCSEGF